MCNLYSLTKGQAAIIALTRALRDRSGNLPPLPGIFPDYSAPIVRSGDDGLRELNLARWGMPTPKNYLIEATKKRAQRLEAKGVAVNFGELLKVEPDSGVTNIRNVESSHWRRWTGVEHRCLVPFTSFSENQIMPDGSRPPTWFALDESRPLAVFAGIWTRWSGVRKMKEGPVVTDLFGFLTTEPNRVVAPIHPKAMPVILTEPEEIEIWMGAPLADAKALQRPLPDHTLKIVARGAKQDGGIAA